MVINHFGMRSNIESFNLGGMGCSAGMIAVDLAAKMLRERGRGGYALVVSTENITMNWYHGNLRSMLIPNTMFRMGSAAVLLTNKRSERRRAKYELQHVVRVHLGADDKAYSCVFQRPDDRDFIGVELSKDLVGVAGKALETNMTRLGPLVLPWSGGCSPGW
jgi:3-ketoacyl-CoA synthase